MYELYFGEGGFSVEVVDCHVLVARGEEFALGLDDSAACVDGTTGVYWCQGSDKIRKTFEFGFPLLLLVSRECLFLVLSEFLLNQLGLEPIFHFQQPKTRDYKHQGLSNSIIKITIQYVLFLHSYAWFELYIKT